MKYYLHTLLKKMKWMNELDFGESAVALWDVVLEATKEDEDFAEAMAKIEPWNYFFSEGEIVQYVPALKSAPSERAEELLECANLPEDERDDFVYDDYRPVRLLIEENNGLMIGSTYHQHYSKLYFAYGGKVWEMPISRRIGNQKKECGCFMEMTT